MSAHAPTKHFRIDPFSKGIRYLKNNCDAYQAYTNALRSARSWASRGMPDWSKAWEEHAQAIARAGPKWTLIKRPFCVHQPKSFGADGRLRVGRKPYRRNPFYCGVSIRGGIQTREVREWNAQKEEEARERVRLQEMHLVQQVKKMKTKGGGVRA